MATTIDSAKIEAGLQLQVQNSTSLTKFQKDYQDRVESDLKVSAVYVFDRILVASDVALSDTANEDIDVYDLGTYDIGNGAGRDSLGMSQANVTIHYMFIRNRDDSTGNLVVDSSQVNGWTAWLPSGTHTLKPGDFIQGYWTAGLAVTDASNHILRLTASGGDINYDFEFLSKQ